MEQLTSEIADHQRAIEEMEATLKEERIKFEKDISEAVKETERKVCEIYSLTINSVVLYIASLYGTIRSKG